MSPIKVCFLGTPAFAAVHLKFLLNHPSYKVMGVVTQPDRPTGRKMQLTPSVVKVTALENSLPVLTPENLRKESGTFETIKSWQADVAVVVAFGQILSQEFLDSFKYGAVNIHGSLLPKWRGAAPIQRSLEAGDTEGGVTLQKMVKKLDAGAIIGERKIKLSNEITATELYDRLAVLGCELLDTALLACIKGDVQPVEQDETKVTVASKIEKSESQLNWKMSAREIHNRVRAFTMGPGTFVMFQGKRLKIHTTKVMDEFSTGTPGVVFATNSLSLQVQTGTGVISVLEVQPESKARMPVAEFLKATGLKKGDMFV